MLVLELLIHLVMSHLSLFSSVGLKISCPYGVLTIYELNAWLVIQNIFLILNVFFGFLNIFNRNFFCVRNKKSRGLKFSYDREKKRLNLERENVGREIRRKRVLS